MSIAQPGNADSEAGLKALLGGSPLALLRLPGDSEAHYRTQARHRAARLLRQSIYGLIALYLLVVVPIYLLGTEAHIGSWIALCMLPIGLVLGGLWLCTRLPGLDRHIETSLCLGLFFALLGAVFCALLLGQTFFGRMSSYIAIYVLIIAFSILQLPARLALGSALAAGLLALLLALAQGLRPFWLDVMLFFGIPLLICTVNGYILELAERRNHVQTLLLNAESERLHSLRLQAEQDGLRQQRHAEFLELISGNPGVSELLSRTLAWLIGHTDAQVAVAYVPEQGRLKRAATWAAASPALARREQLDGEAGLLGPALRSGELLHLQDLPAHYLPIQCGSASLACGALLVIPLCHEGEALAVIELGRLGPFDDAARAIAESIRRQLGYALLAARAVA